MSFEAALQSAVFGRLSGYSGMPTVYDDVPDAPSNQELPDSYFPYVVVGEDTHAEWDTDDSTGAESTITLHVWSRYKGKKQAKDVQALIYEALHRYDLDVEGFHLVTIEFEYSDVFLDADGKTRHGVCRYRALVEAEESIA